MLVTIAIGIIKNLSAPIPRQAELQRMKPASVLATIPAAYYESYLSRIIINYLINK